MKAYVGLAAAAVVVLSGCGGGGKASGTGAALSSSASSSAAASSKAPSSSDVVTSSAAPTTTAAPTAASIQPPKSPASSDAPFDTSGVTTPPIYSATLGPSAPATSDAATTEASSTSPPPPVKPAPTKPAPEPNPVTYTGNSDDVVTIHKPGGTGPVLAKISYHGANNFIVKTPDSAQLLVNTIGSYEGTTLLDPSDGDNTSRLQVSASGPWAIKLSPLTAATSYTGGTYKRAGDQVLEVTNGALSTATFASSAMQSNFIVTEYPASGNQNLLVNVVAPPAYHGTVPLSAPSLLSITAVGLWTMTTK